MFKFPDRALTIIWIEICVSICCDSSLEDKSVLIWAKFWALRTEGWCGRSRFSYILNVPRQISLEFGLTICQPRIIIIKPVSQFKLLTKHYLKDGVCRMLLLHIITQRPAAVNTYGTIMLEIFLGILLAIVICKKCTVSQVQLVAVNISLKHL